MLVAVPSKGRAGVAKAQKILKKSAVFYVPASEAAQYRRVVKNVVEVPNSVRGITQTRNWILKNTKETRVVMVDDDPYDVGWTRLYPRKAKRMKLHNEDIWLDQFARWFDICEQVGFKIWGVKTETAARSTVPFKPILFKGYVTASCMGIINDGEYYFDEDFQVKEDYELCLRHIVDKGGILCVRYVFWKNDHWEQDGGCKDYRTISLERDAIKRLAKMYPNLIKSAKRKANMFTIKLNV